jgi:hypothetical protein
MNQQATQTTSKSEVVRTGCITGLPGVTIMTIGCWATLSNSMHPEAEDTHQNTNETKRMGYDR